MANLNLNLQRFPFFNSVKTPITADGTSAPFYNSGYDSMTLEVISDASPAATKIVVEGCVNSIDDDCKSLADDDCQWTEQLAIDMSEFKKKSPVTNKGIYAYSIAGLSRVRIRVEGIAGPMTLVGAMEK